MVYMNQLYSLGWHLCARRPNIRMNWRGDLIFRKNNRLFILETIRGNIAAKITADLMAPVLHDAGFVIYYGHLEGGSNIRGIYRWEPGSYVETICI